MININKVENTVIIKNMSSMEEYMFPVGSLYMTIDKYDYVNIKSISESFDWGGNLSEITINDATVDRDSIFDLFDVISNSPISDKDYKIDEYITLTSGKGIKVTNGVVSVTGDYVTHTELEEKEYLSEVPTDYITLDKVNEILSQYQKKGGYVTNEELEGKKYLSEIPSTYITEYQLSQILEGYQKKDEYITKAQLEGKKYLSEIPSNIVSDSKLESVLASYQPKADYAFRSDLKGYQEKGNYITVDDLKDKGYLTSHQSLENYYTKAEIDSVLGDVKSIIKRLKNKG